MSLFSKLEKRFHTANHTGVRFVLVTDTQASVRRLRQFSDNLRVIMLNTNDTESPFGRFEVRSAYVFDRCGRLVFIIHYPWSTVLRPFVKASILSTLYDQPCGECKNEFNVSQIILSCIKFCFDFFTFFALFNQTE